MATGRTLNRFSRAYVNGYDLSGYARKVGPLSCVHEEGVDNPINATYTSTHLGQASISPGTLDGIFDNTATTGLHALQSTITNPRYVLVAQGIRAAPAQGDPAFCAISNQDSYQVSVDTPVTANIQFSPWYGGVLSASYGMPWGWLLHADSAVTAVNSSTGVDLVTTSTAFGGFMMYHVLTSAGTGDITATIKVQDSDTNVSGDFDDLLTSGVINTGAAGVAVPTYGTVALGATATVRQYARWQIVLGTATSVTFVLAFVRNFHN